MVTVVCCVLLYFFFRTDLGTAMRATGDNPHMICALGVSVDAATIFGLAMSNGLIALCGALIAQYQGFADVQMGVGMVVLGIASVIIGESLVGTRAVGLLITGTVMGSVSVPAAGGDRAALGTRAPTTSSSSPRCLCLRRW